MHTSLERIVTDIVERFESFGSNDTDKPKTLSDFLASEILTEGFVLNPEAGQDIPRIVTDLAQKLKTNNKGLTLPDVFSKLEEITNRELHSSIQLHWFDSWSEYGQLGGWLDAPDSVDFADFVISISEEFGSTVETNLIDDTIGKTVREIWRTS